MKKVLVASSGSSGSWQIRGVQLGSAIGAEIHHKHPRPRGFDLAVVVKRADLSVITPLREAGVPWVWDIVDAWPQPVGNTWTKEESLEWLRRTIKALKPFACVAATQAMRGDVESLGVRCLFLPHHARPGAERNPIRPSIKKVGYEGGLNYLGKWETILSQECARRGWEFVLNPKQLAEVDIITALRCQSGYPARAWKSGVKLSNAQGSGTPFVGVPECGYLEQAVGTCERFVETSRQLDEALSSLVPHGERTRVSSWMSAVAPRLDTLSPLYRRWLEELV